MREEKMMKQKVTRGYNIVADAAGGQEHTAPHSTQIQYNRGILMRVIALSNTSGMDGWIIGWIIGRTEKVSFGYGVARHLHRS